MHLEATGKKQCIPLAPVQLHTAFCAQMFSASSQYVPEGLQRQSGYEQKQPLRMERGEAAWLTKNKKIYPAFVIIK
jgi:hypothetical protein